MCRPSLGVGSRRWTSRDADGPIGRHRLRLEQRIPARAANVSKGRACVQRSRHASRPPRRQSYHKAMALSNHGRTKEAYLKRELYHRLQVRSLQRDVQLTGPLALGTGAQRWWWRRGGDGNGRPLAGNMVVC
jgi:hypothetical protein